MHVRSLIAAFAAATLLIGVTTAVEAKGVNHLVSVSQAKALDTNDCGNNDRNCDQPPPQTSKKNKADKKNHGGSMFNSAGKDMVYCLPPTC